MTFSGFELPRDLDDFRLAVRDFVRGEIRPAEALVDPTAEAIPDDIVAGLQGKARQAGYWMFSAPVEYGGAGLSTFQLVVILEQAAQHKWSIPHPGGGAFGKEPPVVMYRGTSHQIEKYVVPSIRNGWMAFNAISEPSGGSDPARAIRTTAQRRGDRYILNGVKLWASNADTAQYGVVYARTDPSAGRGGISAFIVEAGTPGMSTRPIQVIRDHHTVELVLDNCEIPADNLLGPEGKGFELGQQWLARGRLTIAAVCVGVAEAALDYAIDWARERETFGAKLATRQAVQFMIADSLVEIRAARWLTWEAAWKDDSGVNARHESSIAKLYATEMAFRVVDRAMQILGGMGMSRELPLESWFRAIRVWRVGEGASEIHRMLIARDVLGAAALGR